MGTARSRTSRARSRLRPGRSTSSSARLWSAPGASGPGRGRVSPEEWAAQRRPVARGAARARPVAVPRRVWAGTRRSWSGTACTRPTTSWPPSLSWAVLDNPLRNQLGPRGRHRRRSDAARGHRFDPARGGAALDRRRGSTWSTCPGLDAVIDETYRALVGRSSAAGWERAPGRRGADPDPGGQDDFGLLRAARRRRAARAGPAGPDGCRSASFRREARRFLEARGQQRPRLVQGEPVAPRSSWSSRRGAA